MIDRDEAEQLLEDQGHLFRASGDDAGEVLRVYLDEYRGWPSFCTVASNLPDWETVVALHEAEHRPQGGGVTVPYGLAAAAPRVAGALADRVPLQAALGAAASGLAVCATAREHGVTDAAAWVPLLAKVLLDRDVTLRHVLVPNGAAADALSSRPPAPHLNRLPALRRPRPARALERGRPRAPRGSWPEASGRCRRCSTNAPHGLLLWRAVGKLSVGLPAGWLDDCGGIRRASRRTAKLLRR